MSAQDLCVRVHNIWKEGENYTNIPCCVRNNTNKNREKKKTKQKRAKKEKKINVKVPIL